MINRLWQIKHIIIIIAGLKITERPPRNPHLSKEASELVFPYSTFVMKRPEFSSQLDTKGTLIQGKQ